MEGNILSSINYIQTFVDNSKFWFPLLLSLISALIFWIIFSYQPARKRKKQLRPIVEYDIYSVQNELFTIFDLLYRINLHSASLFQPKIRSGQLTKKDFYIALQNKCMNESYMYPQEISSSYLVIGESLVSRYKRLNELIDKITNYNEYANTYELLLLEKIRNNIKTYGLNEKSVVKNSITVINGQNMQGVVSNLGYMYQTMYDLYKLYMDLQEIIFLKSEFQSRNLLIHKIQFLYYGNQFKKCKKVIKKEKNVYENTIEILDFYDLLCDYKLGKTNYKKVKEVLNKKYYNGSLVSSRGLLEELLNDETVNSLVNCLYKKNEIDSLHKVIDEEEMLKKAFLEINMSIASFFEEKDTRFKTIIWKEQ